MPLTTFIEQHCARSGTVKLVDFIRAYIEHGGSGTRTSILRELVQIGFVIGEVGRITTVGGLSLVETKYTVDARGQLVEA